MAAFLLLTVNALSSSCSVILSSPSSGLFSAFSSWATDEWFSKGKLFTSVWLHFSSAACCYILSGIGDRVANRSL